VSFGSGLRRDQADLRLEGQGDQLRRERE